MHATKNRKGRIRVCCEREAKVYKAQEERPKGEFKNSLPLRPEEDTACRNDEEMKTLWWSLAAAVVFQLLWLDGMKISV